MNKVLDKITYTHSHINLTSMKYTWAWQGQQHAITLLTVCKWHIVIMLYANS